MCDGVQNVRKGRATNFPCSSVPDFDMLKTAMRLATALIAATFAASVLAKLCVVRYGFIMLAIGRRDREARRYHYVAIHAPHCICHGAEGWRAVGGDT
jgi:hypothetical protein